MKKGDDYNLIWEAHMKENRRSYHDVMAEDERFHEIAYKYYGDMEEDELKLHYSVLEDLLEMDELSRREAQGQGPQR